MSGLVRATWNTSDMDSWRQVGFLCWRQCFTLSTPVIFLDADVAILQQNLRERLYLLNFFLILRR